MADKDKKLSVVYSELLTAIDAALADVVLKDEALVAAKEALSIAEVLLSDKNKKQRELLAMYPELAE